MRNFAGKGWCVVLLVLLGWMGAQSAAESVRLESSALALVQYDARAQSLEVVFRSGARYRYAGVPTEIYQKLLNAPSKGRFYNERIRRHFQSTRINTPPVARARE